MKIVFAPDSFKGSLSALEITRLLEEVAGRHFPGCERVSVPVADGGEGTVDALVAACGGREDSCVVTSPLGTPVLARYGMLADGTAVIEMAQASGLPLVGSRPDPLRASSYGTGELVVHALDAGVDKLLIGIGGSATNDGGMGMLAALGARFEDDKGQSLRGSGADLCRVSRVDLSGLHPKLAHAQITVICDVTNPLLGTTGATAVYGPQKGVTPALAAMLEKGMKRYAKLLSAAVNREIADIPSAGAAGGMGAALGGVLGAKLRPGIDAVLEAAHFDALLAGCDLVVTGEGRLDGQSVRFGKVPTGVARRCAALDIPVIAIVGGIGEGAGAYYDLGLVSIVTTVSGIMPMSRAMAQARMLYIDAAERAFRLVRIGMQIGQKPEKPSKQGAGGRSDA